MESTVDAMAAAYDALVDAAAAVVREPTSRGALDNLKHCLDAFVASCDRAEDLVRAAAGHVALAAGDGNSPTQAASSLDSLCHAVQSIVQDLQVPSDLQEDKDPPPPVVQEKAAAEDN